MINNFKRLKNIGKFYDCCATHDSLSCRKSTFILAPNAYGKSTLVNVLRSLKNNDPKIIQARKTLNSTAQPEATIKLDSEELYFNGTKWSKPFPSIQIFDSTFIHENILAHEIGHEHRKNIHSLIIGAKGITLNKELVTLKNSEKELRKQVDTLTEKFRSAGFIHTLDAFLGIHADNETTVAARIQKLEQDIKSKESESQVRALRFPNAISAPNFDIQGIKTLFSQKLAAVHKDSEQRVLSHIARNFKDKTLSKEFIRQGIDVVQSDCPFCGQDLKNASELLLAYQQYFNDSFRNYQQSLVRQASDFIRWNLDNELTTIASTHNANIAVAKQWEPFIGATVIPDAYAAVENRRATLSGLKDKVQIELVNKQKDPNADIDFSSFDKLAAELAGLKAVIDAYNAVVADIVTRSRKFIDNLPKSDVESMRRQLSREREIEKRFKPEWKQWSEKYQKAKKAANDLLNQKTLKQNELNDYTKDIFETHEKRINALLDSLGADFKIIDLTGKTDDRANDPYSDFGFLILEKRSLCQRSKESLVIRTP